MTGCDLCGVGPEDDCSDDCPSRTGARGRYLGDAVDPGWWRAVKVDLGGKAILFYDDGSVRFAHRCDRGERGIVDCAPLLQIGPGHEIVSDDPLTIRPSILCPDCGTHGYVTDSRWVE